MSVNKVLLFNRAVELVVDEEDIVNFEVCFIVLF